MKGKPARRFGLIDAMILVAATAAGLAWGRTDLVATVQAKVIPTGTIFSAILTRPVTFIDRLYTCGLHCLNDRCRRQSGAGRCRDAEGVIL